MLKKRMDAYLKAIEELSKQDFLFLSNISPIIYSAIIGSIAGYVSYKINSKKEARKTGQEKLENICE
jgi:ABC-type enterochelin transport system permease subunit